MRVLLLVSAALFAVLPLQPSRADFRNTAKLTSANAPPLEFYKVITADRLCLQGVTPQQCATAAHTVHGVGTYDNGYVSTGTMTTPLRNETFNPDKPGEINQAGFVLKTDSAGELLWVYTSDDAVQGYYDSILSVVEGDRDDAVPYALYAAGITWSASDYYDRVLVKINPATGEEVWRAVWPDPKGVPGRDDSLATGDICGAIEFVDKDTANGDLVLSGYVNGVRDMNTGELKSGGKPDLCHAFVGRLPKATLQGATQAAAPTPADLSWDLYQISATFSATKGEATTPTTVTAGAISGASVRALRDGGAIVLTRVKFDGGDETLALRLNADGGTAWAAPLDTQVQAADIAGPPTGEWFVVAGFGGGPLGGIDGQWTRVDGNGTKTWTREYGYYVPGQVPYERLKYVGEECWGIQYVNDSHGEGVVTACGMGPESFNCPENKTAEQIAACDGFGTEWRNFNLRIKPDGDVLWQTVDAYIDPDGLAENGASEYIALTADGGAIVFNDNDSGIGIVKIKKFGDPVVTTPPPTTTTTPTTTGGGTSGVASGTTTSTTTGGTATGQISAGSRPVLAYSPLVSAVAAAAGAVAAIL